MNIEKLDKYIVFGRTGGKGILKNVKKEYNKKVLMEKANYFCSQCNKTVGRMHDAEVDHIIPVMCAGDEFDESNLQILCRACHRYKTDRDKQVIFVLKKLKILYGSGYNIYSSLSLESIRELYKLLYDVHLHSNKMYNAWYSGEFRIERDDIVIHSRYNSE